jgi:hypothetical protein
MAALEPASVLCPSGLQRYDWLLLRESWDDLGEVPGIAEALYVHEYDICLWVLFKHGQKVIAGYVHPVAETDELRESDPDVVRVVQNRGGECTAVREQPDVAPEWKRGRECGIHADLWIRVYDAHAVGSDESHAVLLDDFPEFLLLFNALAPDLLETRAYHHESLHALLPAILDYIENKLCRHDNHRHIDLARDVEHTRVALDLADLLCIRIHGVEFTFITVLENVIKNAPTNTALLP